MKRSANNKSSGMSKRKVLLLSASLVMAAILLGASTSTAITAKAWAQASSSPSQSQTSTSADIKSKAKVIENTVISALRAYANAIGAKYIEIDLFNQTKNMTQAATGRNNTGGIPTVVNQTGYTDAKNMIAKAQDQLQSLSQTANLPQATRIARVQGGIDALESLVESKAPFNLAEDVVQSPIINNLRQLS